MAFEMTHLRFALELTPKLDIQDLSACLSGAIYPDSRYVTGIHRSLTHGKNVPADPFAADLDDFHKGWATHVLYDREGIQRYKDLSPWPERKIIGFGEEWIFTTAAKLVEDLMSYDTGSVPYAIIEKIESPEPQVQEDPMPLTFYYKSIKALYRTRPTLEDYRHFWISWKIDRHVIERLITKTEDMLKDTGMVSKISLIYPEILDHLN